MGSEWFSLFLRIFPLFLRPFFPLFLRFSLLLLKDKGKQQQFAAKMGNFTPTPSAPTPCKTSRTQHPFSDRIARSCCKSVPDLTVRTDVVGSSQTWLFQTWLFAFFTRKRSFALFWGLAFALFCAHLRSFARFCVRPRLERPRLGTAGVERHDRIILVITFFVSQRQKRYPKELLRQRFRQTFGCTFWCDLPQNPCFIG